MIYCLGRTDVYDEYIATDPHAAKLGKTDNYPGGSVWRTREAAEKYRTAALLDDFSVYGVDADWSKDTEPNDVSVSWHNLIPTSKLVKLT